MSMQKKREKIRISNLRFIRRDLRPIELPLKDLLVNDFASGKITNLTNIYNHMPM